jgi:glycosyltransferase involved in cell wall biosynthesis
MDVGFLPGSLPIVCPIKVFEYLAAGTVPMIPDTPANREVILDGENGLLFAPGAVGAAYTKIRQLVEHEGMISILQPRANQTIRTTFHPDQVIGDPIRLAVAAGEMKS